jgi:alanyl-tRNA synthetase
VEKRQYRVLWWNVSPLSSCVAHILICRHVATTDVIKDLVITEEGSVAKGIRRVVAVTGHDAYEVQRKGKEFDAKLDKIKELQGKDKEAAMKPFLTELGQSNISLVKKNQLRESYEKVLAELQAVQKAKVAADSKMVSLAHCQAEPRVDPQITDEIKQYFDSNPNENVYVGVFGVGGNAKVSTTICTTYIF